MLQSVTAPVQSPPARRVEYSAMEAAESAFDELVDWLLKTTTLASALHEVESEHASRGREVLRRMFEAHIRARGPGDVGPAIVVVARGEKGRQSQERYERGCQHSRQMKTVFGTVLVVRQAYTSESKASIHPIEQSLPFPGRSFSYELQRSFVRQAAQGPLDEARATITEFTGVVIGKGSAEVIIAEAATDFDAFYEQKPAQSPDETASILVAETDGKGVPMIKPPGSVTPVRRKKGDKSNKKKMATLGAVYTKQPHIRTPEEVTESLFQERPVVVLVRRRRNAKEGEPKKRDKPENKRLWASLKKGKDAVLKEISAECERRDPNQQKTRVALTDGEIALQKRVLIWLPGFLLILDLMHALQRLWNAAHVFHKEGSKEAEDWVKQRTLRILQGKVVDVVRGMRISAKKRKLGKDNQKAIEEVANYLRKNRHFMRYDQYLAQGLPIATGNVEGAAKNLVKDRMERSGMRWSEDGAEAILQLRALYLSNDFDAYWTFHIDQEQARLHPPGRWKVPTPEVW